MIAVDASVLIAYLKSMDAHHDQAIRLVEAADGIVAHTITLAEVLTGGARIERAEEMAVAIAGLGVGEVPRAPGEALGLAELRVATGLKMPDCCVILAAETSRCALATFDARLAKAARDRGLHVEPVS